MMGGASPSGGEAMQTADAAFLRAFAAVRAPEERQHSAVVLKTDAERPREPPTGGDQQQHPAAFDPALDAFRACLGSKAVPGAPSAQVRSRHAPDSGAKGQCVCVSGTSSITLGWSFVSGTLLPLRRFGHHVA